VTSPAVAKVANAWHASGLHGSSTAEMFLDAEQRWVDIEHA
jgi:hypothetical protein